MRPTRYADNDVSGVNLGGLNFNQSNASNSLVRSSHGRDPNSNQSSASNALSRPSHRGYLSRLNSNHFGIDGSQQSSHRADSGRRSGAMSRFSRHHDSYTDNQDEEEEYYEPSRNAGRSRRETPVSQAYDRPSRHRDSLYESYPQTARIPIQSHGSRAPSPLDPRLNDKARRVADSYIDAARSRARFEACNGPSQPQPLTLHEQYLNDRARQVTESYISAARSAPRQIDDSCRALSRSEWLLRNEAANPQMRAARLERARSEAYGLEMREAIEPSQHSQALQRRPARERLMSENQDGHMYYLAPGDTHARLHDTPPARQHGWNRVFVPGNEVCGRLEAPAVRGRVEGPRVDEWRRLEN